MVMVKLDWRMKYYQMAMVALIHEDQDEKSSRSWDLLLLVILQAIGVSVCYLLQRNWIEIIMVSLRGIILEVNQDCFVEKWMLTLYYSQKMIPIPQIELEMLWYPNRT